MTVLTENMQRHCDSSEEHQVPIIITKENVIVLTKIPARVDGFLNIVEYLRCMPCMESLMKEVGGPNISRMLLALTYEL